MTHTYKVKNGINDISYETLHIVVTSIFKYNFIIEKFAIDIMGGYK